MDRFDPNAINRLIGRFTELQENWEGNEKEFDWSALQSLAREAAHAYNEGAGPSFHSLALDGTQHTVFHERFLIESIHAGFDPFKLVRAGNGASEIPVIDHNGLAEDAQWNSSSARMRACLMDVARDRFGPLAQQIENDKSPIPQSSMKILENCADSIPTDLLERIAPELVRASLAGKRGVDPAEGYLSTAEVLVDGSTKPYG